MAARLEYPPEEIINHIHEVIGKRSLPNGMFRYGGGGLENSSAIPGAVNEMLLQSHEGVLRLFPCWDRSADASFFGLRAYGAFVVRATLENGEITARILSEKGGPLRIEKPGEGYAVYKNGAAVTLDSPVTVVDTAPGETLTVRKY